MREEIYSDYLDNLTIADIEKLQAQGYWCYISNGHVLGILVKGCDLNWN